MLESKENDHKNSKEKITTKLVKNWRRKNQTRSVLHVAFSRQIRKHLIGTGFSLVFITFPTS